MANEGRRVAVECRAITPCRLYWQLSSSLSSSSSSVSFSLESKNAAAITTTTAAFNCVGKRKEKKLVWNERIESESWVELSSSPTAQTDSRQQLVEEAFLFYPPTPLHSVLFYSACLALAPPEGTSRQVWNQVENVYHPSPVGRSVGRSYRAHCVALPCVASPRGKEEEETNPKCLITLSHLVLLVFCFSITTQTELHPYNILLDRKTPGEWKADGTRRTRRRDEGEIVD